MTDQSSSVQRRRGPHILSIVLFVAALGFAAAAVYFWYSDNVENDDERSPPTAAAGMYSLVNVVTALDEAGLEVDYGRSPATANANQIDPPGQNLEVGDTNVYVFFFAGADASVAGLAREQAFRGVEPATMTLQTASGNDVSDGQPLTAFEGANVIAVLIGGDDELRDQVREVIEGLS
ncbi:MAG: hypothetical protein ACR2GI_03755 [Thermomicrobiales bacterium]